MDQIDFLKIISILIAFITIVIAYNQYKINKYKIKYDLYERRFKAFELCHELLDRIITNKDLDIDRFFTDFVRIKDEGHFLFNRKTAQQIEDYYKIGFYYRYYNKLEKDIIIKSNELDLDLVRTLNIDIRRDNITNGYIDTLIHSYSRKHFYSLKDVFFKYLSFRKLV
jgi:hypothetical protein